MSNFSKFWVQQTSQKQFDLRDIVTPFIAQKQSFSLRIPSVALEHGVNFGNISEIFQDEISRFY